MIRDVQKVIKKIINPVLCHYPQYTKIKCDCIFVCKYPPKSYIPIMKVTKEKKITSF